MRTCILRGMLIPDFLRDGADYGEEGPALKLDTLMVQVAALRTKSLALLYREIAEPSSDIVEFEDLAAEAQNLDTALASWPISLPEKWMFCHSPPSSISAEHDHMQRMVMPQSGVDIEPFDSLLTAFASDTLLFSFRNSIIHPNVRL
jgi:hypothetical protein